MPRILHVTEVAIGGLATYLNELLPIQSQAVEPHTVALVLPDEHSQHLADEVRRNVRLFTYRRTGRNISSILRLTLCIIHARRVHVPEIIHAHSSFAGFVVRCLRSRAPIVYSPHGWAFDMNVPRLLQVIYAWVERVLAYRASLIVNVSEYECHSAASRGLAIEKMRVVHPGISIERLGNASKPPRSGPIRLLFVGRFDAEKGAPWLVETFLGLPPNRFALTLVGANTRGQAWVVRDSPGIRVVGWQAPAALDDFYDEADVVVVPSVWEAFGLVAVEAMRRGTPVLTSGRGALPEIVISDLCGQHFQLEDPAQFKSLLLGLSREQLVEWGINARKRYLEKFTGARMASDMTRAYQLVLDSARSLPN